MAYSLIGYHYYCHSDMNITYNWRSEQCYALFYWIYYSLWWLQPQYLLRYLFIADFPSMVFSFVMIASNWLFYCWKYDACTLFTYYNFFIRALLLFCTYYFQTFIIAITEKVFSDIDGFLCTPPPCCMSIRPIVPMRHSNWLFQ